MSLDQLNVSDAEEDYSQDFPHTPKTHRHYMSPEDFDVLLRAPKRANPRHNARREILLQKIAAEREEDMELACPER